MSNNSTAAVRELRDPDPRIQRSIHRLGLALVELIQERDFDDITVQNILDRSGVGRTTFYAHYRNKQDVLHSSYERVFLWLEPLVERPSVTGPRLFPVTEFLTHVAEMRSVLDALRASGQLDEMWPMFVEFASRMIERRMGASPRTDNGIPHSLAARMLAGALVQSIDWWLDHQSAATPAQVEHAFHAFALPVAQRAFRS